MSTEDVLEAIGEEGSSDKREQLISDIEEGGIPSGQGGNGDFAISKPVSENEESSSITDVEDFTPAVEDIEDFSSDVDKVEEFSQPTDSIPDKKVSVSIEELRKKMSDDKDK